MNIKILTDECIHYDLIRALRDNKFNVKTVKELKLSGKTDEEIFAFAVKNKLILLTFDRGFGDIFRFSHKKSSGTVILLIKQMTKEEIIRIALSFFNEYKNMKSKVVIIGKQKIRIVER